MRDKLWARIAANARVGGAMLLYRSNTEQGFAVRTAGDPDREIVDREGLMLVRIHSEAGSRRATRRRAVGAAAEE